MIGVQLSVDDDAPQQNSALMRFVASVARNQGESTEQSYGLVLDRDPLKTVDRQWNSWTEFWQIVYKSGALVTKHEN
jgi:hypothetical protein